MGTTPAGVPYPEPSDVQASYPATAKTVAEKMPCGGLVNMTTNASPGVTAAVTFPVGQFTAAPKVVASRASSGVAKGVIYAYGATVSGFTVGVYNGDGTANAAGLTVPAHWIALP
jgi:hypothetical protein